MRKQVFGRKFKRDANERKALLKGLMTDLVLKESIQTTEEKAKAIKGQVEKLVTKAKRKGENAESLLQPYLSVVAYKKVINDLSKRFADRPGGYTRIVKVGQRFGDNAKMAIIEWVDKTSAAVAPVAEKKVKVAKAVVAKKPVKKVEVKKEVKTKKGRASASSK
ncbi:MAG TPA: 50S ribosomal protein L17 [Candidatus Eisenbacteria bacterium]|nr:50S ribosomal protein L17 [Candidatus Eisenbacteria bacterium]